MSTLTSARVANTLSRLYEEAEVNDGPILGELNAQFAARGDPLNDAKAAGLLEGAFIPVAPEVGRLIYLLVRLKRPQCVVEFGSSHGLSAIHIAAALRDNGAGRLVATEQSAAKVQAARRNLEAAGLADLVEVREGDAFNTLARGPAEIDLLMLDGWKELYLPMLRRLEPRLTAGALVIADDLQLMPEVLAPYVAYVRDPANGYVSVDAPIDDGLELSLKI